MKYRFSCRDITKTLVIPTEFVDEHMLKANGEYIKVYLFMLRNAGIDITSVDIADALNMTEGDVDRAIAFWERNEVIIISSYMSEEKADVFDEIEDLDAEDEDDDVKKTAIPAKVNTAKLKQDEAFSALLYMAQKYLQKIFKQTDIDSFAYMYDVLKLSDELIEYIVELSVQRGKTSVKYIEAVAMDFHSKGITTIAQAKADSVAYSTEVYTIMRAFGLGKRDPVKEELRYIDKWFREYGFSKEIVVEACDRTMNTISGPSFPYADSILKRWHDKHVITMDDIAKLDKEHQDRVQRADKAKQEGGMKQTIPVVKKNSFNSFEQRKDELDSLALEKLKARINRKNSDK